MQYLGLDVHVKATVWHLLDATGQTIEIGKTPTTVPALQKLVCRFSQADQLLVGQEVGKKGWRLSSRAAPSDIASRGNSRGTQALVVTGQILLTGNGSFTTSSTSLGSETARSIHLESRRHRRHAFGIHRIVSAHARNTHAGARADGRHPSHEGKTDRCCQTTRDYPSGGRASGTDDLRLGRRCDTLPQCEGTGFVRGTGSLCESEWRITSTWQDHPHGLAPATQHIGAIRSCASVAMQVGTFGTAQGDRRTSTDGACTAQDSCGSCSTSHSTHRVLRIARWHELRSDTLASGTDQRGLERSIGGNPRSGISKVTVEHGLASEAIAGEVEGDQVAQRLGSRPRTARARSLRLDWPILLPVRQHVPGHRALEHAWKDGDPWRSVSDTSLEQRPSLSNNIDAVPDHHVNGAVHSSPLTAIMEGRANLFV